jgi:hypothetical protein
MRHWLTHISVLGCIALFLAKLPALGSAGAMLLAACLTVATVGLGCALFECSRDGAQPADRADASTSPLSVA